MHNTIWKKLTSIYDLRYLQWTNLLQTKFVHDILSIHNLQLARKYTFHNLFKQTFGFVNNIIYNHWNDYDESKKYNTLWEIIEWSCNGVDKKSHVIFLSPIHKILTFKILTVSSHF